MVGGLSLFNLNTPKPMIGINLRYDHWGRGYGPAAMRQGIDRCFRQDQAKAVTLMVVDWNGRALRVYERLGFRAIGKHEQVRDDREFTYIDMEITREDWEKASPP
jgi:RimJ/RimL family protein N-acetyltransferase